MLMIKIEKEMTKNEIKKAVHAGYRQNEMTEKKAEKAGVQAFRKGQKMAPAINSYFIQSACAAQIGTGVLLDAYIHGWTVANLAVGETDETINQGDNQMNIQNENLREIWYLANAIQGRQENPDTEDMNHEFYMSSRHAKDIKILLNKLFAVPADENQIKITRIKQAYCDNCGNYQFPEDWEKDECPGCKNCISINNLSLTIDTVPKGYYYGTP